MKKKREAKMKKSCIKLQSFFRMRSKQGTYERILLGSRLINKVWRGFRVRRRMHRVRDCQDIMDWILDLCVKKLYIKVQNEAAIVIQKWIRGHIVRCKYYPTVLKIRKYKRAFIFNRSALIIQRNVRRFIV